MFVGLFLWVATLCMCLRLLTLRSHVLISTWSLAKLPLEETYISPDFVETHAHPGNIMNRHPSV